MTQLAAHLLVAGRHLHARLDRDDGVAVTEYLGMVVVVALIIGAIVASDVDSVIAGNITDLVRRIFDGGRTD